MSDQQIQDRRSKLDKLRSLGVDPFGSRFTGVISNADIRAAGEALDPGAGVTLDRDAKAPNGAAAACRAAGRVVLQRDIGSLIFLTIRDRSGDLQVGLSKKTFERGAEATGSADEGTRGAAACGSGAPGEAPAPGGATAWKVAKLLDLGDFVGVDGVLGRTRTGELTLWADSLRLLSKAVRPPPEKYHGLTDIEARYRRRYVDLFANPESARNFILRAQVIRFIRDLLHARGYIEVETPVLQPVYGGAAARPFTTHHNALDMRLYLRISPELYLKRCLVGGLERVFEFSRCFRNEGISPRHNPEFTMLELYQAYGDYHDMMDITEAIIAGAAASVIGSHRIPFGDREIDYAPPWPRRRYADLVREYAGVDIGDAAAVERRCRELGILARLERARAAAAAAGAGGKGGAAAAAVSAPDPVLLINALFEETVEDKLINPTFVIDYPAPLCPLTKRHPSDANLALRFEAYVNGMEMGNAYSELNDPDVQRANLAGQVEGEGDETMRVMDEDFCEALEYGMPPAGGLGIGVDRLCMLLTGSQSIRDVLLFPLQRAEG
ncbi:MAG: lysine--tRNA ligase [Planctomycetia bacterium]|nr:MAG: lysine--tRNA ligase [Planctomycetia bacterium]